MISACLLAIFATLPQDPPHEPTMLERIDALIAKTNAYEHFVARYHLRGKNDIDGELELAFRAPNQARVRVDGGGSHADFCVHGDIMEMRASGKDMGARTATIRNARAEAACQALVLRKLKDAFPKELENDRPADEHRLDFVFDVDTDGSRLDFECGYDSSVCFMWLVQLRGRAAKVSWSGGEHPTLVYSSHEDLRVVVSAENGLITRIERQTKEGVSVLLELIAFDPATPPEAKELEPGPATQGADDNSEAAEADFARRGYQRGRASVFATVARMLDDGRLEWNDAVADQLAGVLRALAADQVMPFFRPVMTWAATQLAKQNDLLSAELEEKGARTPEQVEALREELAQARDKLEQAIPTFAERLCGPALPRGRCKVRPSLPDDLGALERRVLAEIYGEQVTKTLLESFDKSVAKLLDAK